MVSSFVSEAKELRAKEQALFIILAELNGWSLLDSTIKCDAQRIPTIGDDSECYARISDGDATITFSKHDFGSFVNKIADYFAFELEHVDSTHIELE